MAKNKKKDTGVSATFIEASVSWCHCRNDPYGCFRHNAASIPLISSDQEVGGKKCKMQMVKYFKPEEMTGGHLRIVNGF